MCLRDGRSSLAGEKEREQGGCVRDGTWLSCITSKAVTHNKKRSASDENHDNQGEQLKAV